MSKKLTNFSLIIFDESNNVTFEQALCQGGKSFSPAMIVDIPKNVNGNIVKIMFNGEEYLHFSEIEVLSKT